MCLNEQQEDPERSKKKKQNCFFYLVFVLRCKSADVSIIDIGPLLELLPPLLHRDTLSPNEKTRDKRGFPEGREKVSHVEVQRTMVGFLMVQQAVMPTKVLPAPQGKTIIPERARLLTERR